jgi:hypothetical protein
MFVTSKNPKYLNLGRDIENATLRMAHMRRLIDMMQGCLGSGVTVLESFKELDDKGKYAKVEGEKLEHLVQVKMILSNIQECITIADSEFEKYVNEFDKLDKTFIRLKNAPQPKEKKVAELKPQLPEATAASFPDALPAPVESPELPESTEESKGN